jgi:hypothetical protein
MARDPHLNINRISSVKPTHGLSDGIVGMAFKNVEIGNSLFIEEWTSHVAVESGAHISASQ